MGAILNGIDGARRLPRLRRDVPRVLRLHAARGAARGAAGASRSIYVWTHDSIGLGEDGPTHQPIEHLRVAARDPEPALRPARPTRSRRSRPGGSRSTRQDGPDGARADAPEARRCSTARRYAPASGVRRGGLRAGRRRRRRARRDPDRHGLRGAARARRARDARRHGRARPRRLGSRASSSSSTQDAALPRRGAAAPTSGAASRSRPASTFGWSRLVGDRGRSISIERYGASAPAPIIYEHLGITSEAVAAAARELLQAD